MKDEGFRTKDEERGVLGKCHAKHLWANQRSCPHRDSPLNGLQRIEDGTNGPARQDSFGFEFDVVLRCSPNRLLSIWDDEFHSEQYRRPTFTLRSINL
jgi:hypothetical protein